MISLSGHIVLTSDWLVCVQPLLTLKPMQCYHAVYFDILLTVHLSIILVINQLNAQIHVL